MHALDLVGDRVQHGCWQHVCRDGLIRGLLKVNDNIEAVIEPTDPFGGQRGTAPLRLDCPDESVRIAPDMKRHANRKHCINIYMQIPQK